MKFRRVFLLFSLVPGLSVSCMAQPAAGIGKGAAAEVEKAGEAKRPEERMPETKTPEEIAREVIAPLLDPAKVATLKGDRPVNARLYRILYWLETARAAGGEAPRVLDLAQEAAGYAGSTAAKADKQGILWSRAKLEEYGCHGAEGMEKLRKGGSPVITRGGHAGDSIALDHVLPRAVVPELAARFYNLEAIPAKENLRKSAKIGKRELELARRWRKEGLVSEEGLKAVEAAAAGQAPPSP